MFEIKSIPFELKDIDTTSRRVVKYVSAFGNVDSHGDIMQKGSYAKTIKENKHRIKFLYNHDSTKMPIGVLEEIEEDDFGLKTVSRLLNTTDGNNALECYKEGAITEHSVGFYTKQKKSDALGNRVITEAHLLEYSAVPWGSNPNTPFLGLKSTAPVDQLAELQTRSQKLYKLISAGNLTDEMCQNLAIEHTIINKAMSDIIQSLSAEPEVISTPIIKSEPVNVNELFAAFKNQIKL